MFFLVLGQALPESILMAINEINLEAMVMNHNDVIIAWINKISPMDDCHLIISINTNDNMADPTTSSLAKIEAGC